MRVHDIKKYRGASVTFKATIWYTVCNMLQKIAAFLIIPFLTRILSISEYGLYSVFLSWMDIIEIIATMKIYGNGYVAGLVRYSDDQDRYTCSIQFVSVVAILINLVFFSFFSDYISDLIQIKRTYIFCMFFSFFATSSIGIWSSRQRVNNRYKLMVFVTLIYSVLAPLISIVGASLSHNQLEAVIIIRVVVQFIIAVPFFFLNMIGRNKMLVYRYCREAFVYNIPLIPYYLSMIILNNSDRIMIKNIIGETEAGIYSVAYSLSMIVVVFVGALNLSMQPWIFNKLRNDSANRADKIISFSTGAIAVLNLGILVVAPELINIVASEKYSEAIWTMPPIIFSVLIIFIYQQILNINFYFGKTKIVFLASIVAAVLNIVLNAIFIRIVGYIAAGYTTLISYLVITIFYYISMRIVSKKQNINYKDYFDIPFIITIVILFGCFSIGLVAFYPYPIIRYGVILFIFMGIVLFRKKLLYLLRKLDR